MAADDCKMKPNSKRYRRAARRRVRWMLDPKRGPIVTEMLQEFYPDLGLAVQTFACIDRKTGAEYSYTRVAGPGRIPSNLFCR